MDKVHQHLQQVDMDKVAMMPLRLVDMELHLHPQQYLHLVLPLVVMTATVPLKVVDMVDNTR